MTISRSIAVALCVGLLSSCGSDQELILNPIKALISRSGQDTPLPDPRARLTQEILSRVKQPILYVGIPKRNGMATIPQTGINRDAVTWQTPDGVGLTFRSGVLVATRGLGDDLLAADVEDILMSLDRGAQDIVRIYDYLGGEDQVIRRSYVCSAVINGREDIVIICETRRTTRITETCVGPDAEFTNTYWRAANGTMLQSNQYISDDVGILETQLLVE